MKMIASSQKQVMNVQNLTLIQTCDDRLMCSLLCFGLGKLSQKISVWR